MTFNTKPPLSEARIDLLERNRRLRADDGTAALEGAIVAPVLFIILLGMVEFGLVFRDYLTVSDGAADAAKYASIQGNKPTGANASADFTAVSLLRQDLANIPTNTIDRIVIFRAGPPAIGGPLQQVPSVCKTSPTSVTGSACNVYPAFDAFYQVQTGNADYFKCVAAGDRACAWNPLDKNQRQDGPHVSDISYLGVYIKVNHSYVTKLFGNSFPLEVATVQRLEPGQLKA